jgi:hypothetical protein
VGGAGALDVKIFGKDDAVFLLPELNEGGWLHEYRYEADVWAGEAIQPEQEQEAEVEEVAEPNGTTLAAAGNESMPDAKSSVMKTEVKIVGKTLEGPY